MEWGDILTWRLTTWGENKLPNPNGQPILIPRQKQSEERVQQRARSMFAKLGEFLSAADCKLLLSLAVTPKTYAVNILDHGSHALLHEQFTSKVEEQKEEVLPIASVEPTPFVGSKSLIVPLTSHFPIEGFIHPLSPNEDQMLRLFISQPYNTAYNLPVFSRTWFRLDAFALERACRTLIQHHHVLRSAYKLNQETPIRQVLNRYPQKIEVLSVRNAEAALRMLKETPHALGLTGVRFLILADANGYGIIGTDIHHALADAESCQLLARELYMIQECLHCGYSYDGIVQLLPHMPIQFTDFAYWQASLVSRGLADSDMAHWYSLNTATSPPLVLDIPADSPRPRVWNIVGRSLPIPFEHELLTSLVQQYRTTPFAIVLALFGITLIRCTMQQSVAVAVPFGLRHTKELVPLIGNFVNMIVHRIHHKDVDSCSSTLERAAASVVDMHRFSMAPFVSLVQKLTKHHNVMDPSRNGFYQSMFDMVPGGPDGEGGGLEGILDFFLFAAQVRGRITALVLGYNTTILEEQSARRMALSLMALTRWVAYDANVPLPRSLPAAEEAQDAPGGNFTLVPNEFVHVNAIPYYVQVPAGFAFDAVREEYSMMCNQKRYIAHSLLGHVKDGLFQPQPPSILTRRVKKI